MVGKENPSCRPDVIEKIRQRQLTNWKDPNFRKRMLSSRKDEGETEKHLHLKEVSIQLLKIRGYTLIKTEYPILANNTWYIVDVVGFDLDKPKVAIECGHCSESKLEDLEQTFDAVLHIPYR